MTGLEWLILGLSILVVWTAWGCFALQDFAYSRLEDLCQKHGRPERFSVILKQQDHASLTLQMGKALFTMLLSAALMSRLGPPVDLQFLPLLFWSLEALGLIVAVLVGSALGPWVIARVTAEPFLYWCWPLITGLQTCLGPVTAVARGADRYAHRLVGRGEPDTDDAAVIEEEIRTVVDEGQRGGLLEKDAGTMIARVIEMQDEDVGAIMTPRTDMLCLPADATLEEARTGLIESGHSRMPVIGESTDDILGILYAKDLLKAFGPERERGAPIPVLRDIIREPVYVPVTTEIPAVLELMRREHVHIAMVLDEYGGVAGLVTMEDILEEIVGEIGDEYDEKPPADDSEITVISPVMIEVDGRVHLDDLNRRFAYGLPEDAEFDTIAGFVFSLLGRLPGEGDTASWEQRLTLTVLGVRERKITRVRIESAAPMTAEAGAAKSNT